MNNFNFWVWVQNVRNLTWTYNADRHPHARGEAASSPLFLRLLWRGLLSGLLGSNSGLTSGGNLLPARDDASSRFVNTEIPGNFQFSFHEKLVKYYETTYCWSLPWSAMVVRNSESKRNLLKHKYFLILFVVLTFWNLGKTTGKFTRFPKLIQIKSCRNIKIASRLHIHSFSYENLQNFTQNDLNNFSTCVLTCSFGKRGQVQEFSRKRSYRYLRFQMSPKTLQ